MDLTVKMSPVLDLSCDDDGEVVTVTNSYQYHDDGGDVVTVTKSYHYNNNDERDVVTVTKSYQYNDDEDDLESSDGVLDLSSPAHKQHSPRHFSSSENVSTNNNSRSLSTESSLPNSFINRMTSSPSAISSNGSSRVYDLSTASQNRLKHNDESSSKNECDDSYKSSDDNTMILTIDGKSSDHVSSNVLGMTEPNNHKEENEFDSQNPSPENVSVHDSSSAVMVIKSNLDGSDCDDETLIFTPENDLSKLENSTSETQKSEEGGGVRGGSKRKRKAKCPVKTFELDLFEDPTKSFMCSVCGKVFNKKCNLQDHMRIHTGEKPFKCGICFKGFTVNSSLQVHLRTHTGEKPFQCQECGKMFTVGSSLNAHMKIHTGDRKYQCSECHKTFVKNGDLKNHMTSHTGEKNFQCDVCFKRFSKTSSLTLHKKLHLGEVHKCPEPNCEKEFPTSTYLQMHMKYHSADKPFKCDVCEKSYRVKGDLQIHMRNHSGEKPFRCDVCFKGFTRNDTLILHMRTHTGEKPYACPICEKRFSVNCALHRHIRIHTGVKPYVCVVCAKAFDSSSNRQKHMKIHQRERDMLQNAFFQSGTDVVVAPSEIYQKDLAQSVEVDQHKEPALC